MPGGTRLFVRLLIAVAAAFAAFAVPAFGSPSVLYGAQDDAWLRYGPGTLTQRIDRLQSLGVEVMRINVDWSEVEPRAGVFNWSGYDPEINALHIAGIEPVLTLVSTPSWANGGQGTNFAPTSGSSFAAFASAAASHYRFVK